MDDDDAMDELQPPSAERVAARTLVLLCVVARANIERDAHEEWAPRAVEMALDVLSDNALWDEVEPAERALLEAPLGRLDERALINGTWRAEGLGVLAWGLQKFDLPPIDEPVDVTALTEALGMADAEGAASLLALPQLRPHDDLRRLSEQLFTAHWRLREFDLTGGPLDLAAFAREAWFGPLEIDGLPLADGDLAIGGLPLVAADPNDVREANSILSERRTAVGWLLGEDELYSEVPIDT